MQLSTAKTEDKKYRVAILRLDNPPINGLDLPLVSDFSKKIAELNSSKSSVNGIVIASTIPRVFSAGIEFKELYNTDSSRLREFWAHLQNIFLQIYSSPHPTVAAINGHCLAGGTLIAASTDYRIGLSGSYKLGVTAARIGVVAPPWFQKTLVQVVGHRIAELMLTQGKTMGPDDALRIGLLDEVYSGGSDLVSYCVSSLRPFMETYPSSRIRMKRQLRGEVISELEASKKEDSDSFVDFVLEPSVQRRLKEYIEQLKKKK